MLDITILYVLLALLLFGVLVFVHELGHYLAARACGVRVIEFAIGMGPKLLRWTSKKTNIKYSLRLFPVGGFCSMEGEGELSNPTKPEKPENTENTDAPEPSSEISVEDTDPHSYKNKPAWVKLIILVAGPFMNILLGVVMTFVMVIATRGSDGQILLASNKVAEFGELAISAETGLKLGDTVIKVGNVSVHTGQELSYEISMQAGELQDYNQYIGDNNYVNRKVVSVDLTVIRDGETVQLEGVKFLGEEVEGTVLGNTDFKVAREDPTVGNIIKQSWFRSLSSVKMVWDSLIGLITGRFALSSVSGPVGTTQVITQAARSGWYMLLYIFIVISMNLGVFNLLPVLPLDGGHVVFALYELIFRKPVPKKVEETCQMIGVMLMFGLMIVVTFKDLFSLF